VPQAESNHGYLRQDQPDKPPSPSSNGDLVTITDPLGNANPYYRHPGGSSHSEFVMFLASSFNMRRSQTRLLAPRQEALR
jgi:hypothetical protein